MKAEMLQALLREGAETGVYPGAQACIVLDGEVVFEGQGGDANGRTLYDLASLTKIISTTSCFMSLWAEGKLGPATPLARVFPESPAAQAGALMGDLLYHRSGLPDSVAYFARAMPAVPELFKPDCPPSTWYEVREAVVEAAARTGLACEPRESAVYSDVGFILLGEAVSRAAQTPLDALFTSKVAGPLELDISYRRLSQHLEPSPLFAPTGATRPRELAPGQKPWQAFGTWPSAPGEVDDDNAWVMDGVAGHAGLFGRALDVARFGQCILEELSGANRIAPAPLWQMAVQVDGSVPQSTRAMGFDTPSAQNSSAGRYLGKSGGAVGHLGFTGVSLWVDLGQRVSIALCTNRTFLGRAQTRIREFRPRFHDAAMEMLGFGGAK